jgi:hypothetical protein
LRRCLRKLLPTWRALSPQRQSKQHSGKLSFQPPGGRRGCPSLDDENRPILNGDFLTNASTSAKREWKKPVIDYWPIRLRKHQKGKDREAVASFHSGACRKKRVPNGRPLFLFCETHFFGSNLERVGQAFICSPFFFTAPPKTHSLKTSLWHC